MNEKITRKRKEKPYFLGQKPVKCGHYYPDSLRIADVIMNKTLYRIVFCKHCKVSVIKDSVSKFMPKIEKDAYMFEKRRKQILKELQLN